MARFGVNSTLANPAYMGGLFEAARGVGASAGNRRERQAQKTRAEEMNAMEGTLGMLQYQVQNARTPEEAMKAQMLLENFKDLETQRANAKADRETATQDRTRKLGQEEAKARISSLMNERKRFEQAGNTEAVAGIDRAISSIAVSAGVEAPKIETLDSSKRYLNIGGGKVFDSLKGEFVTDATETQLEGPELEPKDFLSNVRQIQKDDKQWTEKAFQSFLTDIKKEGVYGSAEKHLTEDNMVDYDKQKATKSTSAMNDAASKMSLIDEILDIAPDMNPEGGLGNVMRGVGQQVGQFIGGTEAKEIETKTKTLQAKEAFGALQTMRDNSKTGGALGSISERELDLLMSDARNLDPSSPDFKDALREIKGKYQRVLDIEMGPQGGSPNYVEGENGQILYVDPVSKIVYDYETGDPDPRYN